jgi:hypothetical protein
MSRSLHSAFLLVFAAALAAPLSGRALDREYVLRWLPPSGDVSGYRVYLASSGQATQALDLGAVAPDPDGVAREALQLDATRSYSVSMTAYNAAGESSRSNQVSVQASSCDPAACDDRDPCTADDCQNLACTHTRMPDGAVCGTGAVCIAGSCRVPQCTSDADCADGDLCDGRETCAGFACASGSPLVCPAPGPCQQGGCSASSGCFLSALPNGTRCDDGNVATANDQCSAGRCAGEVPSGCSSDAACGDGNLCNGTETCGSNGACLAGTPLSCGAPTQCADPSCSPTGGCALTPRPEGTGCDDGSSATTGDRCVAGRCLGTAVEPPPPAKPVLALHSVSPSSVRGYGQRKLVLGGSGFASGLRVGFRSQKMYRPPGIIRVYVRSPQEVAVTIYAKRRYTPQIWDVVVTLPDGRTATLPASFQTNP